MTGQMRGLNGTFRSDSSPVTGRLRRERRGVRRPVEAGVPAAEVAGELVVEDAGTDLEQEVGAACGPAHLLFLTMRLLVTWPPAASRSPWSAGIQAASWVTAWPFR